MQSEHRFAFSLYSTCWYWCFMDRIHTWIYPSILIYCFTQYSSLFINYFEINMQYDSANFNDLMLTNRQSTTRVLQLWHIRPFGKLSMVIHLKVFRVMCMLWLMAPNRHINLTDLNWHWNVKKMILWSNRPVYSSSRLLIFKT